MYCVAFLTHFVAGIYGWVCFYCLGFILLFIKTSWTVLQKQLWVSCDFFLRINFSNFLPSILSWFLPLWPFAFIIFSFSYLRMHLSLGLQLLFLCLYLALLNVLRYPYSVSSPSLYSLVFPGTILARSCAEHIYLVFSFTNVPIIFSWTIFLSFRNLIWIIILQLKRFENC